MDLHIKYSDTIDSESKIFKVIKNFSIFCIIKLKITDDEINVHLVSKDNGLGITTGAYDRQNNVYSRVEGRAVPDILRTIAHEFTHYKQKIDGKFNGEEEVQDIGGAIENEANAMSGILVKSFVKEYNCPWIHEL